MKWTLFTLNMTFALINIAVFLALFNPINLTAAALSAFTAGWVLISWYKV